MLAKKSNFQLYANYIDDRGLNRPRRSVSTNLVRVLYIRWFVLDR
jgi:hypothetical protein